MMTQVRWLTVVAITLALMAGTQARAADPYVTTITADMHCEGCAKKVVTQLIAVPGVAKVEPDVETKTVKVTPKPNVVLSPRALWDAVDASKKKPIKLVGPSGTFTSRPKQ